MVTLKHKRSNAVFRAIADPTRREILGLLRERQHTVGEIAANFRTSRPAISKHIRLLRGAGLVTTRKEGTSHICGLNARPLRSIGTWLMDYESFWGERMRSLKNYIEETERERSRTHESDEAKRNDRSGNRHQGPSRTDL